MKKLLLFIIVVSVCIFGQAKKDINNSTTTSTVPLDSSEVWTGYRVDVSEYNSVSVSMWSDDTATVQLQFGNLVNTVFTVQRYWTFTYIESDTNWTKSVPVVAPYFRAIVTNTAYDSMTVFRVTTLLHKGVNLPTDDNAYVLTNVAVSEPLDSMEVNIEEGNTLLQDIDNNTDGVEVSLDSIEVNTEEGNVLLEDVKTKLDSIEVNIEEGNVLLQDIDNNTDGLEVKSDSIKVNIEESNVLLQDIDDNTDMVETKLDSVEVNVEEANALLQNIEDNTDAMEAGLDSVEVNIEEGNLLLQDIDNNTDLLEAKLDSLTQTEDVAHVSGDKGIAAMAVRNDAGTSLAGATGDYAPLSLNDVGALNTNTQELGGTTIDLNAGVLGAGTQRVTIATDDEINNDLDDIRIRTDSIEVNIEESNTISTDIRTSVQTLDNIVAGSEAQVDIVASLPAGTNAIGNLTDGSESMMIDNGATYDGILVRLTDGTNLSSLSGTGDLEVSGDGGVALATKAGLDSIEVNLEENNAMVSDIRTSVQTLDNIVSGSEAQVDIITNVHPTGNATFGYGANAITTIEQLAADQACKKVTITNFTTGEIIYVGGDNSTTTANGFPLAYMDSMTITVSNLNQVWLISDGTSVDIRYVYEN